MAPSKPLKVVIDARMVRGKMHGIARHVLMLARGFSELRDLGRLDLEPVFLVERDLSSQQQFFGFRTVEIKSRFLSIRELIEVPRALSAIRPDLYHSPSFSSLAFCPVPHVVTVHDLNHLRFGSRLKRVYYKQFLRPFCIRARRVLTVSQFSKDELAKWLKMSGDLIQVVPSAIDPVWAEGSQSTSPEDLPTKYKLKKGRYFVAINSDKSHKNLDLLCRAYNAYRNKVGDEVSCDLALVGGGLRRAQPGIVALPSIEDGVLRDLIRASSGFVFPSLYEGLGLPPVEAIVAGAPRVLVSDIAPHRESLHDAGEAVQFVDPHSTKDWILAFANGCHPEADSGIHFEQGRAALMSRFSPLKMAEVHQAIYFDAVKMPC